jgi:hypothetical protein
MSYNGSGVFARIYNWAVDRDAGVKIRADRLDTEFDGVATGLSTAICRDGQSTTTAVIPFAQGLSSAKNVALLRSTSSAIGVVTKSTNRFLHDYHDSTSDGRNIFLGELSGNFTMSPGGGASSLASSNIAVGGAALAGLTTGYQNIGIGYGALNLNTTGWGQTAVGHGALGVNTAGYNNTAVGWDTLGSNTIGYANTALGYGALVALAGGDGATTASRNVALGVQAMLSATTGYNNAAVGVHALNLTTTGAFNTAVGMDAGYSNVSGNGNTCVGYNAGYNATGSSSVYLGYSAGLNATASSEFYLGNVAQNNLADDKAYSLLYGVFAGSAGTSVGQKLRTNSAFSINGTGDAVLSSESLSVFGVAGIKSAGAGGLLGFLTNSGTGGTPTSTYLQFYNSSGVTAVGSITYNGTNTVYNTTSDERLKTNFDQSGIDWGACIDGLWVGDFEWKDNPGKAQIGVRAQQAVEFFPQAITHDENQDLWQASYGDFAPLALWGVKELRQRVVVLETALIELQTRLAALEAR